MKTKETLFIYIRVSTAEQQERDLSLPRQRELGMKKAEELGMAPVVFEEAGESASQENFDNRPKLFEILRLVKEGTVKHLFVFDQTRLSRNNITKAVISESLKKQKVTLHTHSKRFDFNKEEDVLTFRILEAIETYETALRKARFKLGYVSANKKGRFLKGTPPYGYKKDKDGYLVIDEEEKAVFLRIVDLYLNKGLGTNKIVDILNREGVPTKTSKVLKNGYTLKKGISNRRFTTHKTHNEWNPGTLNTMLKNEVCCGKRKFKTAEDTFEYVACEPIIDQATFDKIQNKRVNNAITKKREDKYFYMLKNICECGNCGNPLHGRVKPNRGEFTYRCNSKREKKTGCTSRGINITKLNNIVWNAFKASAFYHKVINQKILLQLNDNTSIDKRLQDLQKELTAIQNQEINFESKLKKLVKKELDNRIPKKVYDELMHEIKAESKMVSDNKFACISNINMLTKQSHEKKGAESELAKGMSLYKNSQNEIASIYPCKTKENELAARKMLLDFISNVKVTYYPEKRKHIIEIAFHKLGIKKEFNDSAPYRFEEVKSKKIEVGIDEKVDFLMLPIVSNEYFLNDSSAFREEYEKERLESVRMSDSGGSKPHPPVYARRNPKLYDGVP